MPWTQKQIAAASEVVAGKSAIFAKPFARQVLTEAHTKGVRPPVKPQLKKK